LLNFLTNGVFTIEKDLLCTECTQCIHPRKAIRFVPWVFIHKFDGRHVANVVSGNPLIERKIEVKIEIIRKMYILNAIDLRDYKEHGGRRNSLGDVTSSSPSLSDSSTR
jgi:hypothetical protein